jgi:hypothetical protein
MANLSQLESALVKADAEGNEQDARILAAEIRRLRAEQPVIPQRVQRAKYGNIPGQDPTQGMGVGQRVAAAAGSAMDGLKETVIQLANTGAYKGQPDPGRAVREASEARVDERRRLDQPLLDSPAGLTGNILGTLGPMLIPGLAASRYASLAPGAAATVRAATLPTTVRGATVQGAAIGAMQPLGADDSRLMNAGIGGLAGFGGSAAPRVVAGGLRGLMSPIRHVTESGVDRRVADVIRQEAQNPQGLMVPQPSAIPGVQRTLAEESKDAGIARLERNARSTGQGFDVQDRANNSARVAALRTIGGDPAQLKAAEQARDAAARAAKAAAFQVKGVDTSRLVSQLERGEARLAQRPAIAKALAEVRTLLQTPGADTVAGLYNVRKTIGDMLSGSYGGDSSRALAASAELLAVRGQLDRVMAKNAPAFRQYLDAYRSGSVPINRMQLGNELIDRGAGSAIPDPITGDPVLTPAAFSRASGNLDKTAAAATGFRKAKADNYLRPQDRTVIAGVQDDLERRSFAATAGSGGNSHTFERGMLDKRMAASMAARIPGLNIALAELERVGQRRLEMKLAQVLANPAQARSLLARMPEAERRVVENAIRQAGGPVASVIALETSR